MRRVLAAALCLCLAAPVRADVAAALDGHILPGLAAFSEAAAGLDAAAAESCARPEIVRAWHTAYDAWLAVGDIRLGPSETGALSVAFWPDTRGFARRALSGLIAEADPVGRDPEDYADVSIAARGLLALEMLLFDPGFADGGDGYVCALIGTVAADLARQAAALEAGWREDFAGALRAPGGEGNAIYLDEDEAFRAVYTQIVSALEFASDQRLGRPLGTFERPRPQRAEAWRSGRSLRNVVLAAEAAHALAHNLADWDLPATDSALDGVRKAAARIGDPAFQDVGDPQARLRVEILQHKVRALRTALEAEIGARRGIAAGFNSQDGD